MAYALEMRAITKEFPGVRALDSVTLNIDHAEIHALCGENGAGKSTLMKILSGLYPFGTYSGELKIAGSTRQFRSIKDSQSAGVGIIYQELSLVPEMTVAENIFLGREPQRLGLINKAELFAQTSALLKRLRLHISPEQKIMSLGIAQQQLVEIAKTLSLNAKILILDEPTSALTDTEIELLLSLLNELKKSGVTCILITHKLDEVFAASDRITVLRDGKSIRTFLTKETTPQEIINTMVGRELTDLYPKKEHTPGDVRFRVKNLVAYTHEKRSLLKNVQFEVRRGEIVGIAGLMGAGRTELLLTLFGAWKGHSQLEAELDSAPLNIQSTHDAWKQGLSLVPEDRKRQGLVLNASVLENMSLANLEKMAWLGFSNSDIELSTAQTYVHDLRVKTASLQTPVKNLSGGNQQKVVLAKCLATSPKILFLDEPTRGVDVGAKFEIYSLMTQLCAKGFSIVMVSSELPEILGMSDRIYVMKEGQMVLELPRERATQENIMSAAMAGIAV